MKKTPVLLTINQTQALRGLAITAVVVIHALAYLPGIYHDPNLQYFFIGLDQLARFCVPMFMVLSGYGLTQKNQQQTLKLTNFYTKRVLKLLPLYILWSVVSFGTMSLIPVWKYGNQPASFLAQILLGQADYQLYFVIAIIQLYLLFPFLLLLTKRWPTLTLLAALAAQLVTYLSFSGLTFLPSSSWFLSDRFEYLVFFSWIAYFVLGIWLSLKANVKLKLSFFPALSIFIFLWLVHTATQSISAGMDPLLALKFTRWPMMLFALSLVLSMVWAASSPLVRFVVPGRLRQLVLWFGRESFLIFFAHTMLLRITYAAVSQQVSWSLLGLASLIWLVTVLISKKLLA